MRLADRVAAHRTTVFGAWEEPNDEKLFRWVTDGLDTLAETAASVFGTVRDLADAGFGALSATAERGAEALGTIASAADTAADRADRLAPSLVEAAGGVAGIETAATRTSLALARLGGRGTDGGVVPVTDSFVDLEEIGSTVEATLADLAGGTDQLGQSMAEMGAVGAAAGGAVHGRAGALMRAGPAGLAAAAALGAFTAWLYSSVDAGTKLEEETTRLDQSLRANGAAAWLTADQLRDYADTLSETTLASREAVLQAGQELLQYRSVIGDAFDRTLGLAQDMAAAFGGTLQSQVETLGSALDEPAKALDRLTEAGIRFTDEERGLIRELAEAGRIFCSRYRCAA